MSFTGKYLLHCWEARRRWRNKETLPGDWYLTPNLQALCVVNENNVRAIDFAREDIAFVPDTDDLLELLENQIRARGADPARTPMTISHGSDHVWHIEIRIGEILVEGRHPDSIHSLLLHAVYQAAVWPDHLRPKPPQA